jgi:hypothetical protein
LGGKSVWHQVADPFLIDDCIGEIPEKLMGLTAVWSGVKLTPVCS